MKDNKLVTVKVNYQGDAVAGEEGYNLVGSDKVVAFDLDGWGKTGRIYPLASCSEVFIKDSKEIFDYPSIVIEDGNDDSEVTEIYFPEYPGWKVHAVSGGKTMSICLVKRIKLCTLF